MDVSVKKMSVLVKKNRHISEKDYLRTVNVWNEFKMK